MAIKLPAIIILLRPRQWVKNAFVCAGILFGAQTGDPLMIRAMLFAVAAFSLIASSVYVLNDYLDRESDKAHPAKRHRPLASGTVTPARGIFAGLVCLLGALTAAWFAEPRVLLLTLIYLAINVAYSLRLKHEPVIDVFCIASGFMLRIMAGTWGIRIPPSGWLILTAMFLTLFLGFAKRRAEWIAAAGATKRRQVLNHYSEGLLDSFLAITATGTVLSYGLYTLDAKTIALHHTDKLIYTLPFVLFGLFRYLFILHQRRKGENPSIDLFTDHQLILCGLAFTGVTAWILNR